MQHLPSSYLNWYIQVPNIKHDLRSSGVSNFKWKLNLDEVNLTENFAHGNPEALKLLANRYKVKPENICISSDGASGQNTRILEFLSSRKNKSEVVVEYPTYEPMLRQAQAYFKNVKRIERKKQNNYKFDLDELENMISNKTAALVITNPHAPSGVTFSRKEMTKIMEVAQEHDCYVVCDEIYAEFDREKIPPLFSVDNDLGIVTTSFSKAYGLGGLKAGFILASKEVVDELYSSVLSTAGCDSNLVELALINLLTEGRGVMENHKKKWNGMRRETEKWLSQTDSVSYTSSLFGVFFWVETKIKDTYKWMNKCAIPEFSLAVVPGAFFLFKEYEINQTSQFRLGIGNINPDNPTDLDKALQNLGKALKQGQKLGF
jgi:aspartate/methionine/tyrosine aminotransferase